MNKPRKRGVLVTPFPWRKSSYSGDQGGACVECASTVWNTSSYSGYQGGACVEVAGLATVVAVRDSQHPQQKYLSFARTEWTALLNAVRTGEF